MPGLDALLSSTPKLAFLSYTRKDDDFFGGYITAFRKMLENAVHVVTGEQTFHLFQDIEGVVVGEPWQKKLVEVIRKSSFLVPMLSPLFFNSKPCRDEVTQFLEHERELNRQDLILPVYFLTSAKIEKDEQSDPLVNELVKRNIYDWREKANLPLQEPAGRKAILELAVGIAGAISRLEEPVVSGLGGLFSKVKLYSKVAAEDVSKVAADPRLGAGIAGNPKREEVAPQMVLWVDDNPDNNTWERHALASYGIRFEYALDTSQAMQRLRKRGAVAAIISDMGRVGDPRAGFTLLDLVRKTAIHTPYFIYTTASLAATLQGDAQARGAQGITANPDALVEMVLAAITVATQPGEHRITDRICGTDRVPVASQRDPSQGGH